MKESLQRFGGFRSTDEVIDRQMVFWKTERQQLLCAFHLKPVSQLKDPEELVISPPRCGTDSRPTPKLEVRPAVT